MDDKKDDLLIDSHDYDGIQELDNPLPNWWLATFQITIVFGFIYWIHFQFLGGETQTQELSRDMAQVETMRAKAPKLETSEDELLALVTDDSAINEAKSVYTSKCSACHGANFEGMIGPNLTDEFWINGKGSLKEIASLVRKGVVEKGMPAWEGLMTDREINVVAALTYKMRGSNPLNPKPPQGEKIVSQ